MVTIDHFKQSNFWARPDKPYYELDMGIHEEGTKILTFGFINNDKYNDLVTTNDKQNTISVHFLNPTTWKYDKATTF